MLSEKSLQLLTAFVDGDLSARQRKLATRLLHKSSEARQIVKELQENVYRLQKLPKRNLEPEFAEHIVRILQRTSLAAPQVTPTAAPHTVPATLPIVRRWSRGSRYAVAASLLLFAGGGIYLATRTGNPPVINPPVIAENNNKNADNIDFGPTIAELIKGTVGDFSKTVPPQRAGTQLAFAELSEKGAAARLAKELAGAKAVHVEVAVKNRAEAVRRLDKALQSQGIKVLIDKDDAQAKLKNPQLRTEYVLYVENVTADELTALLKDLSGAPTFETMTVSAVTSDDQQQVCQLLGLEPKDLERPPPAVDLHKGLPKDNSKPTIVTIPQRPMADAPRLALVLAADSQARGRLSSELDYFRGQRQPLQPGKLRVILVIHQA
jgi:hypothetical protein